MHFLGKEAHKTSDRATLVYIKSYVPCIEIMLDLGKQETRLMTCSSNTPSFVHGYGTWAHTHWVSWYFAGMCTSINPYMEQDQNLEFTVLCKKLHNKLC